MDVEKARRQIMAAMTMLESALDSLPISEPCAHENVTQAAGNTMGVGNQKYYCADCGEEVTENEWIRCKEREGMAGGV